MRVFYFIFIVSHFPSVALENCRSFFITTLIEELNLSADTEEKLERMGVNSLKDFLSERERELPTEQEQMVALLIKLKAEWRSRLIDSLGLTTHSINVLRAGGIWSIEILIKYSEKELLALPGFGKRTLSEVKKALLERDLYLKFSHSLDKLEFTDNTRDSLIAGGVRSLEELVQQTPRRLLQLPNFGWNSFVEVEQTLLERGLHLSPDIN